MVLVAVVVVNRTDIRTTYSADMLFHFLTLRSVVTFPVIFIRDGIITDLNIEREHFNSLITH